MARFTINFTHKGKEYSIPVEYGNLMGGGKPNSTETKTLIEAAKFKIDNGRAPNLKEARDLIPREERYHELITKWFGLGDSAMIRALEVMNQDDWSEYGVPKEGFIKLEEEAGELGITPEELLSQRTEGIKEEYNPYTQYLEQQRMTAESQELGLLNQQTRAGQQNAEISAQQSMIQQAQLRDQIVEQIKLDRMSKMRQGITPMQIANESLQFTVGNIQANNNQMTGVNQARLAATQQQALNPYQAYLNSINSAGYQSQGNVASGMAATDASDMYQQALRYARSQGRNYIKPEDYEIVQGMPRQ